MSHFRVCKNESHVKIINTEPMLGKIPWIRKCQSTPVFLSGKSYGQKSMADYIAHGVHSIRQGLVTKQQQHHNTS